MNEQPREWEKRFEEEFEKNLAHAPRRNESWLEGAEKQKEKLKSFFRAELKRAYIKGIEDSGKTLARDENFHFDLVKVAYQKGLSDALECLPKIENFLHVYRNKPAGPTHLKDTDLIECYSDWMEIIEKVLSESKLAIENKLKEL